MAVAQFEWVGTHISMCMGQDASQACVGLCFQLCIRQVTLPTCCLTSVLPAPLTCSWRTKIDPVLKSEESRSNFDIQQYGEKIIHRLVPDKVNCGAPR